ncbi:hypothetical protein LINPERPRIM_LOCUS3776 [Linum perenne]
MENDSTEVAEALEERKSFSSHWVDCWFGGLFFRIQPPVVLFWCFYVKLSMPFSCLLVDLQMDILHSLITLLRSLTAFILRSEEVKVYQ